MPRTRSASARAAGGGNGRQQQEQQEQQEARKLVVYPTLSDELVSTLWAETRWHGSAVQTHA